ncbi:putative diguanylate cyclase YegE [Photobacterium damselae subsp. piscicida]|uniref:diguanylate cyclase n=2 Tax=Photobacterium damselae TaxID=38293 RepID=A0A1V1V3Q1_PHODP|nr:diguanylate cyclase [Photobacterium damselae]MBE8128965.1 GGDEF domain-containing protein [Photobacterium damselae subsp. piscicida]PSV54882.1 sensor domain-containing diguanylate cyclase [Photobacterium damselae]PSW75864.1 sensor domain-containing diguanylate cyclase [Photobacterium damselae]QOD53648.1 GGDEF domain-containing protein [Photobacterium damselae subsp. piscicida]QOD57484.1 GGDEF domain-containing protein [Photobacterium damselae subsp. piscicida]
MLVIAVAPAAMIGGLLLKQQIDVEKNYQTEQLKRLSNTIGQEINYRFYVLSTSLDVLSRDRLLVQGIDNFFLSSHVFATLESLVDNAPLVKSAYLLDKDWDEVENYNGISGIESLKNIQTHLLKQTRLARNLKGDQWIFNYYDEKLMSHKLNPSERGVVVPVYQSTLTEGLKKDPLGYLVVVIPMESLGKMIKPYLSNGEWVELNRSTIDSILFTAGENEHNAPSMSLQRKIVLDNEYVADALNYELIVYMDREYKGDQFTQSLKIFTILSLIAIALGLFGAGMTYRWVSQPLAALMRIVREYSRGNYNVPKRNLRFMEFYSVDNLIQEMSSTIRAQVKNLAVTNEALTNAVKAQEEANVQLTNFNDNLEKKVQEKTEELSTTLKREERRREMMQSLIAFFSKVQTDDLRQLVIGQLKELYPDAGWAVKFHYDGKGWNYEDVPFHKLEQLELLQTNRDYFNYQGNQLYHGFNLLDSDNKSLGILVMQAPDLQIDDFEVISIFSNQLASTLEGKILNQELKRIAITDSLTELANRKAFDIDFEAYTKRLKRYPERHFGLCIIDVNGLKQANDLHGHKMGDALLIAVGNILVSACRNTDKVYRLGGDEYAILLEDGSVAACDKLTERLHCERNKHVITTEDNQTIKVSFAVGYSCSDSTCVSTMFHVADEAMYQDKMAYYANNKD